MEENQKCKKLRFLEVDSKVAGSSFIPLFWDVTYWALLMSGRGMDKIQNLGLLHTMYLKNAIISDNF